MSDESLAERAQALQRTAYTLLNALDLMSQLHTLGTPTLVGAARTGLMFDPDIDIILHTPGPPDIAAIFRMLQSLALREDIVDVVFFGNKLRQPYQGLALDIGCYFEDGDWEIAIAVFGPDCPHRSVMAQTADAMIAALDDPTRRIILALKAERRRRLEPFQGGESHGGCESLDLYRAVFDGHRTDYDEALAWIGANPRASAFAAWQPVRPGASS